MRSLTAELFELIRRAATHLPADIEACLHRALEQETPASPAHIALSTILENTALARASSIPLCQDTGTPRFYITHPEDWRPAELRAQVRQAVAEATRLSYLRPNAVDSLSGRNSGDNLGGEHFPAIHFHETSSDALTVGLMLKGGGCENVSAQRSLPDAALKAGRDLQGVRRAVLAILHEAQGLGCAPGFLGVIIGGDRAEAYQAAGQLFLQPLNQPNPDTALAEMEARITHEANQLGIGPMGFGGRTTLLGCRIAALHHLPASYFVTVSYMCWAFRRCTLTLRGDEVSYA